MLPTASEGAYRLIVTLAPAKASYQLLLASQKASREFGPESPEALAATNDLGIALFLRDELKGATAGFEKVLAAAEREDGGAEGPGLLGPLTNLGFAYAELLDYSREERLRRRALAVAGKWHGQESFETLGAMINLGASLHHCKDFTAAAELCGWAAEVSARTLGPDHMFTLAATAVKGVALGQSGEADRAVAVLRSNLEASVNAFGDNHPFNSTQLLFLANSLVKSSPGEGGQRALRDESMALYRQALEINIGIFGRESFRTQMIQALIGKITAERGDLAGGERMIRKAHDMVVRSAPGHPSVRVIKGCLSAFQANRGGRR
jgi:tetratricopeptide (TPR) repeat protein